MKPLSLILRSAAVLAIALLAPLSSVVGQEAPATPAVGISACLSDPTGIIRTCTCDAQCDDGKFCNGRERCAPNESGADNRGCVRPSASPCPLGKLCDEAHDNCAISAPVDADGDGAFSAETGGTDCDDSDANRYPGNHEVCDTQGHDEDCDPTTYGHRDADGDGHDDAGCMNVEYR